MSIPSTKLLELLQKTTVDFFLSINLSFPSVLLTNTNILVAMLSKQILLSFSILEYFLSYFSKMFSQILKKRYSPALVSFVIIPMVVTNTSISLHGGFKIFFLTLPPTVFKEFIPKGINHLITSYNIHLIITKLNTRSNR